MPSTRSDRPVVLCEAIEPRRLLSVARPAYNTGTGFFVSGGDVYDANGEPFVQKGVNAIHAWGSYNNNYATIDQVAKTGSNAVRAVMYRDISVSAGNNYTDAADTSARRKAVVERYLANGIVAVVEDHSGIDDGATANNPAALAEITTHWLDSAAWLKQYERGVILNITNEWGPVANANGSNTVWRDSYITQVNRLRAGPDGDLATTADNVTNLIQIDAGGYGQDYNALALHAQQVLDADPQHNLIFAIHLYGQWRDESRPNEVAGGNTNYGPWDILTRLSSLRNRPQPLPLVIGEFAWEDFRDFNNTSAPYSSYRTRRVLEIADQLGIGWSGWSYNQSSPSTLNMLAGSLNNTAYNANSDLSDWGDALVNDPTLGLKASARRASVFPIGGLPAAPAGLPALPSAPPPATKFVLDTTRPNVPENGAARVRVKLSAAPTTDVGVALSRVTGDASLTLATTALTFTPANWDQYQTITVNAAADADATQNTARFQLTAAGVATNDFTAREIDANLPTGTATLTPVADRGYAGNGTATTVNVTATVQPQPTGALFLRFNAGGLGGRATGATLRVYKTNATSNLTLRLYHVLTDTWSETATSGINASYPIATALAPNAAGSYVEFAVTATVAAQLARDGVVSFAISTVGGSGGGGGGGAAATLATRENASPPQLVVTTAEAVAPRVSAAAFDYAPAADRLVFDFDEDVSATLSNVDVLVESIDQPGVTLTLAAAPAYDAATHTAAFTFAAGTVPDGRYRATLLASGVADAAGNALLEGASLEFFSLAGDVDRDGAVNFTDLVALAQHYGQSGTYAEGDLTGDGAVNFADLVTLAQAYGNALPAQVAASRPGAPARRRPAAEAIFA